MGLWKRLWLRWKAIAGAIADFQARVILSLFYFVVVLPFGLAVRLFADPLRIRGERRTGWVDCIERTQTVDEAMRQF